MTKRKAACRFACSPIPLSRGTSYRDAFGNWVHQFNILPEHRHLKIEAESVVLAHDAPVPPFNGMKLSELEGHREELEEQFLDFWLPRHTCRICRNWTNSLKRPAKAGDGTVSGFVQAASLLIHEKFRYVKGATHVNSSIQDSLSRAREFARTSRTSCWAWCASEGFRRDMFPATSFRKARRRPTPNCRK